MTINAVIGLGVVSVVGGGVAGALVTFVPSLNRLTARMMGTLESAPASASAAEAAQSVAVEESSALVPDGVTPPPPPTPTIVKAALVPAAPPPSPPAARVAPKPPPAAQRAAAPPVVGDAPPPAAVKAAAIAPAPIAPSVPNTLPVASAAPDGSTRVASRPVAAATSAPRVPAHGRDPEVRPLYVLEDGSVPLAVPFSEKDRVKALGARWNAEASVWVVPAGTFPEPFMEWWAKAPLSDLPGEDRGFGGNQLYVDLVPSSCWFTNVRSCVEPRDWDRLRRYVYNRAGNRCEVCVENGERLDAHERWEYDDATSTQVLRRLICLCQPCHQATHFGLALSRGLDQEAARRIALVNCWSPPQVAQHVKDAFALWETRNATEWNLDLSMITKAGIAIVNPIAAPDRQAAAEEAFAEAS